MKVRATQEVKQKTKHRDSLESKVFNQGPERNKKLMLGMREHQYSSPSTLPDSEMAGILPSHIFEGLPWQVQVASFYMFKQQETENITQFYGWLVLCLLPEAAELTSTISPASWWTRSVTGNCISATCRAISRFLTSQLP